MTQPHKLEEGSLRTLPKPPAWPILLAFLAGCQVPPARPDVGTGARTKTLVCQVVKDTAVQVAAHPLKTGAQAVCGTASDVCMVGREVLCKRCLIPLHGSPPPLTEERRSLDPAELESALATLCQRPAEPAHIQLATDGEDALRRLEGLLESAEATIDVLIYLWDADALGWSVARRLADRAMALGADGSPPVVRVLVDGGGNLIHGPPEPRTAGEVNEVLAWLCRQPHVEVMRTRNPLASFDHRKLVIVDGTRAWTGGRNFTLASFFEYHDVSYTLEGALAADMGERFEESWQNWGGEPRDPSEARRPLRPGKKIKRLVERSEGNALARVVATGITRHDLAGALYWAADNCGHHLYLENPYFTDNQLFCKLAKARQRGVDVRMVLARDSQSRLIDRAMKVTINRLLTIGVRVYMYPGTTHVKAATADTRWAYLGTGNFDNLSLRRNKEIGVSISAGPVIEEIEQRIFLQDFRAEWEITKPLPVTIHDYLSEAVANLFL